MTKRHRSRSHSHDRDGPRPSGRGQRREGSRDRSYRHRSRSRSRSGSFYSSDSYHRRGSYSSSTSRSLSRDRPARDRRDDLYPEVVPTSKTNAVFDHLPLAGNTIHQLPLPTPPMSAHLFTTTPQSSAAPYDKQMAPAQNSYSILTSAPKKQVQPLAASEAETSFEWSALANDEGMERGHVDSGRRDRFREKERQKQHRDQLERERQLEKDSKTKRSMSPPSSHATSNEVLITNVTTCVNEEAILRALRRIVAIYEGTHDRKYQIMGTWRPRNGSARKNRDESKASNLTLIEESETKAPQTATAEVDEDLDDFLKDMVDDDTPSVGNPNGVKTSAAQPMEIASSSRAPNIGIEGKGETKEAEYIPFDDEEMDGIEIPCDLAITHITPFLRRDVHHFAKPHNVYTPKTSFDVLPIKPPSRSDGIAWKYNPFGRSSERSTPFGVVVTFASVADCNRVLCAVRSSYCRRYKLVDLLLVPHREPHPHGAARRKGGLFTTEHVSSLLVSTFEPTSCSLERIPTAEMLKDLCEQRDERLKSKGLPPAGLAPKPTLSILSPDHLRMVKDPSRVEELKSFLVSLYDQYSTLHEDDKKFYNSNMHIFTSTTVPSSTIASTEQETNHLNSSTSSATGNPSSTATNQPLSLKERLALKKQQLEAQKAASANGVDPQGIAQQPALSASSDSVTSPTSAAPSSAGAPNARELLLQKLAARKSALAAGQTENFPSAPSENHAQPEPISAARHDIPQPTPAPAPVVVHSTLSQLPLPQSEGEDIALEQAFYRRNAFTGVDWYFKNKLTDCPLSTPLLHGFPLPPSTRSGLVSSLSDLASTGADIATEMLRCLDESQSKEASSGVSAPNRGNLKITIVKRKDENTSQTSLTMQMAIPLR